MPIPRTAKSPTFRASLSTDGYEALRNGSKVFCSVVTPEGIADLTLTFEGGKVAILLVQRGTLHIEDGQAVLNDPRTIPDIVLYQGPLPRYEAM